MATTDNPGSRRPKKRNSDKVDLRLLIAAASITATLGGVGYIAAQDPTPALSSQALAPTTQAATSGAASSGATTSDATTQQAPQATATAVPDLSAPIEAPEPQAADPAPTATPEPLPQVTIPQRQWPMPMGRSRSSR